MFRSLSLNMFRSMTKCIFFSLFFIYSYSTLAGNVTLRGNAEGLTVGTVGAFVIEDYISEKRVLLQSAEISPTGDFIISFDLNETQAIVISINRIEGLLYVSPGQSYRFVFPPAKSVEVKKFDRTSIELQLIDEPESSINSTIRSFNSEYASFVSEHFFDFAVNEYRGSDVYIKSIGAKVTETDLYKTSERKDSVPLQNTVGFSIVVDKFINQVNETYSSEFSNLFFKDYVTYSLAELELMAGMKRDVLYQRYFMSQPMKLNNPSYMRCFELFYNDFLSGRNRDRQNEIVKAVNHERSPDKLISIFENDSTALSRQIRTLAVIKGLKDIYFNKTYTRNAIEVTLSKVSTEYPELKRIAENTLGSLRKCKEGWQLEDFVLVDQSEHKWMLSEQKDKPLYLLFFASWNTSSLKEMQMMKNLHAKYQQDFDFVAISMDDSYEDFRKYLESHTDEKFTLLYGSADPLLTQKCNVFSVPYALMLDDRGVVSFAVTRLPSQGIQSELEKIMVVNKQNKQGPKTWKD
jgi:peroxiredoxin